MCSGILKKIFKHIIIFLVMYFYISNVIAQPMHDLNFHVPNFVNDIATEDRCIASSNDITYTYHQLHANLFQNQKKTELPAMSQIWQVICSAPVKAMFVKVQLDASSENTSDTDPTKFGLGSVNRDGVLGSYRIKLDQASVDGQPVQLYSTTSEKHVGRSQSVLILQKDMLYGWATQEDTPAKGQIFSVQITILPILSNLKETNGPLVHGAELGGELILDFSFDH